MELALESTTFLAESRVASSRLEKMRLTSDWASSKFPRMAQTATLPPICVTIWRRWTSDTLPQG